MLTARQYRWITIWAAILCAWTKTATNDIYTTADISVKILTRTSVEPYRFRVAGVYVSYALAHWIAPNSWLALFTTLLYLLNIVAIIVLILLLYKWLGYYTSPVGATLTTLAAAFAIALIPNSWYSGWAWTEALFVLGALFWLRKYADASNTERLPFTSYIYYLLLVIVACLNRETGLYLVILYAAVAWKSNRRDYAWGLLYLVAGVATYLIVRLLVGPGDNAYPLSVILSLNQSSFPEAIINIVLLLGPFWYFAWKGFKCASPFVKNLAYSVPFYLIPVLVFGVWRETRLFVPIIPILMTLTVQLYTSNASVES